MSALPPLQLDNASAFKAEPMTPLEAGQRPATFSPNAGVPLSTREGYLIQLLALIGGGILCFTGIGALLGIPLALWALLKPTKTRGAWQGDCPKCQSPVVFGGSEQAPATGFDCPICNGRLIYRAGTFTAAP